MNVTSLTADSENRSEQFPRDQVNARKNGSPALRSTLTEAYGNPPCEQIASLYRPIKTELDQVESQLTAELSSRYEELQPLLKHGTQLGGKRLRPAMLLLIGRTAGSLTTDHLTTASVIEMVHTATLIHDDVLDEAESRRHVSTINAKWNNHTSILLGDYLFSQAYRLAATTSSTTACGKVGEAARRVCEGELRQVMHRDQLEISEDTYIAILQAKTGELCRVACELGALFSGGTATEIQAAAEFGNSLGIAFQIADDYHDLWGNDRVVGKTLGTDLQQGKITLPILRLLQTASDRERVVIETILRGKPEDRFTRIMPLLNESDACEYTQSTARRYHADATQALEQLPAGEARDCLSAIADFSINRSF